MRAVIVMAGILMLASCKGGKDVNMENEKAEYARRVQQEALHAWTGYKTYAWGHDILNPLSRGWHDWHKAPLCMSAVDAFTTLKLMGLEEPAGEAKDLIFEALHFDRDFSVQVFEINIRFLAGLLSAYQMDGDPRFLKLALDLAGRLLPAFDSPTGMPYRYVHLRTGEVSGAVSNPAEIGTLILEWGTLSRITGDVRYYNKAKAALNALFERRSAIGLVGSMIDVETGEWTDTESHLSGMIDSYYEYLLKGWLMFDDPDLKRMWEAGIRAVNRYLADEKEGELWYGRADMHTGKRTRTWFGALDAFFPGVLALSGDLERAAKLQESCYRMWTLYGIEPEMLDYQKMEAVTDYYVLRPENIESAFYLYYFTGNDRYLEMGKTFFDSLVRYCRTETGYAHLKSVITREKQDAMDSYFLAETLKYCYLLFAPDGTVNLDRIVFTTEAHPLKRWK